MDSRQKNYLAIAGLVVLIIGALFFLLPLRQTDSVSWQAGTASGSSLLKWPKAVIGLTADGIGVKATADVNMKPLATLEQITDSTATVPASWRISATTESTLPISVRGVVVQSAELSYGTTFTIGPDTFNLQEGGSSITQGLDLRGGLSVILTPKKKADTIAMQRALVIMNTRVNGLGVSEATVQLENDNQAILVQLPGVRDARAALDIIGQAGQLEFVEVASLPTTLQAQVQDGFKMPSGSYKAFMTGDVLTSANAKASTNPARPGYEVSVSMNASGTAIWAEVTTRSFPTQARIAILLDGTVVSAPAVNDAITSGDTAITGNFTAEEARRLAAILESGALPVDLQFSQTEVVGPTLGQDSLFQGITAALVGFAIVAIYLAIYYRGFGILSWVSLGSFAVVYLGVLAVLSSAGQYALSLPGIAGVTLSIGMAADTSILIFERYKEEIAMGRTPRAAAKSGTKHAILTSLDADAVTFASAIPLFLFAIGPVKGFALTLMIGIICDLTIAMLFTRPAVILLAEKTIGRMPRFFGVKGSAVDA
jgi:preprotein translocase subunit SecD/SecD/SecF fusion protein